MSTSSMPIWCTLSGTAVGIVGSLGLTRFLASLLQGTSTADVPTFVLASGLLVATALLASCLPAVRALRVDPVRALRHE